jgi:hypothetical protein
LRDSPHIWVAKYTTSNCCLAQIARNLLFVSAQIVLQRKRLPNWISVFSMQKYLVIKCGDGGAMQL